jgi:hypothetical protein
VQGSLSRQGGHPGGDCGYASDRSQAGFPPAEAHHTYQSTTLSEYAALPGFVEDRNGNRLTVTDSGKRRLQLHGHGWANRDLVVRVRCYG